MTEAKSLTRDTKAIIIAIATATITITGIVIGVVKSDISELRQEVRQDIGEVRQEMRELRAMINANAVAIGKLGSAVNANTAAIAELRGLIISHVAGHRHDKTIADASNIPDASN